jgi:ABC-type Fe3+ transport system permease subunit
MKALFIIVALLLCLAIMIPLYFVVSRNMYRGALIPTTGGSGPSSRDKRRMRIAVIGVWIVALLIVAAVLLAAVLSR